MTDWIEQHYQEQREKQAEEDQKGGPGSGHWGHAGRPGKRGGSLPGNVAASIATGRMAGARQARAHLAGMMSKYEAELARLNLKKDEAWDAYDEVDKKYWALGEWKTVRAQVLEKERAFKYDKWAVAMDTVRQFKNSAVAPQREVLYVDNPAKIDTVEQSKFKGNRRDAIREGVEEARKMIGTGTVDGKTAYLKAGGRGRSRCAGNTCFLTTSARQSVTIHEMGHWLEHNDAKVRQKATQFLLSRTEGQKAIPLRKLVPKSGYDKYEIAIPDKFTDPYMGKIYGHGSTEIVSMGMQEMWNNPAEFAVADPEYFDFMYNLLRGQ